MLRATEQADLQTTPVMQRLAVQGPGRTAPTLRAVAARLSRTGEQARSKSHKKSEISTVFREFDDYE